MQDGRDDLKDSFYLRVIRTSIGEALRDHYDLTEPLPDKLLELVLELDTDPETARTECVDGSTGDGEMPEPDPSPVDPETLAIAKAAFSLACAALLPERDTQGMRGLLAKCILDAAAGGERDPGRLSADALRKIDKGTASA